MASSIHVEETFLHVLKNRPSHIIPKKSVFRFIKVLSPTLKYFLLQKTLTFKSYTWWGRVKKNYKRDSKVSVLTLILLHTHTHSQMTENTELKRKVD